MPPFLLGAFRWPSLLGVWRLAFPSRGSGWPVGIGPPFLVWGLALLHWRLSLLSSGVVVGPSFSGFGLALPSWGCVWPVLLVVWVGLSCCGGVRDSFSEWGLAFLGLGPWGWCLALLSEVRGWPCLFWAGELAFPSRGGRLALPSWGSGWRLGFGLCPSFFSGGWPCLLGAGVGNSWNGGWPFATKVGLPSRGGNWLPSRPWPQPFLLGVVGWPVRSYGWGLAHPSQGVRLALPSWSCVWPVLLGLGLQKKKKREKPIPKSLKI